MTARLRRRLLLALLLVFVALALWTGWTLWRVSADLRDARSDAMALRDALADGEARQARGALEDLRSSVDGARAGSDGVVFSALSVLPGVGDDVEGVQRVSRALDTLSDDGLPPLVSAAEDIQAGAFLPNGGSIDVAAVQAAQRPVAQARSAFESAADTLDGADTEGFVGQLAVAYDDLESQVDDASGALDAAEIATQLLPGMLGADGERRWIALFQTPAELRTTGGLPGAAALISADGGQIDMRRQSASLPMTQTPVLPLTKEEKFLYDGDKLGTFYQDANFIPHWPRVSELIAAHWQRNFDQEVDGVVSFDPVLLSYLLEATGPVTVGERTVSADNAVDLLLHDIYQEVGPEQQDAFFAEVARGVFDQLASGAGDPQIMLEALARGVRERRLFVASFDDAEQEQLTGRRIAGEVEPEDGPTQLGIYLNDATMSKLTYFLDYEVTDLQVESCQGDEATLTGALELSSRIPPRGEGLSDSVLGASGDFLKVGHQLIQVELHSPQGGTVTKVTVDGEKRPAVPGDLYGHGVVQTFADVTPGGEHVVDFTMTAPRDSLGAVDVRVTPGVETEDESLVLSATC